MKELFNRAVMLLWLQWRQDWTRVFFMQHVRGASMSKEKWGPVETSLDLICVFSHV